MTGRFALAVLLTGYGLSAVAAASRPPISSDARAAAAMTDLLPPPAPLADSTVATVRGGRESVSLSNLRRGDFARALWVDAADPALQSREAIRKLIADCRAAGFNAIYALVRSGGTAAYLTDLVPRANGIPVGFDPLAVLLEEARAGAAEAVQVHAWMRMTSVGARSGSDPRAHVSALHPEWLTSSAGRKGNPSGWLDPASPEVRQHLATVISDLAKRYAVNGLILEDAGYAPTLDTGYLTGSVERFRAETGSAAVPAPADLRWIEWRRAQAAECTRFLRQAARAVRPETPVALLSVVDGPAPADRATYSKDVARLSRPLDAWPVVAESAGVDALLLAAPQGASTAAEASALEEWTAFALQSKGAARLVVGVQARARDAKSMAALMLDPILEPRADGVAVLPGTESPSRMDVAVFRQLFDPALVEAHAQRLASSTKQGTKLRDAGLPRLSGKDRMSLSGAAAPISEAYLQAAPPPGLPALPPAAGAAGAPAAAGPGGLPPMATPAPIGPGATSLPPLPGPPAGAPPALPPPPAAPPAAPAGPAGPPVMTPNPANQLPLPALPPPSDAPPSLPPVTAPPPADAPVPVLPPPPPAGPPVAEPGTALPPLGATGPEPGIPAPLPPVGPGVPGGPLLPPAGGSISDTTNFTGAPIAGPVRVAPTITPPSIRPAEPVLAGAEVLNVGQRSAIAAPQFARPDFSDPESIFVPRVAPPVLRDYAPPPNRPTDRVVPLPEDQLEVIVLSTGKEFVGRVIERGPVFRVQMPNGGIVKLDASRVAAVRASTRPLDVRPLDVPPASGMQPLEIPPLDLAPLPVAPEK